MKKELKVPKLSKKDKERRHQKDFYDFHDFIAAYKKGYLPASGYTPEIKEARIEECDRLLKYIKRYTDIRLKPIQTLETVRGLQIKLGETFCIKESDVPYIAVLFPDSLTVQGYCKIPPRGHAKTIEVYLEDIYKPRIKLPKIKVSDYFKTKQSSICYKVAELIGKENVKGTNKLTHMGSVSSINVHLSNVIKADKKEYKKQHVVLPIKKKKKDKKKKKK